MTTETLVVPAHVGEILRLLTTSGGGTDLQSASAGVTITTLEQRWARVLTEKLTPEFFEALIATPYTHGSDMTLIDWRARLDDTINVGTDRAVWDLHHIQCYIARTLATHIRWAFSLDGSTPWYHPVMREWEIKYVGVSRLGVKTDLANPAYLGTGVGSHTEHRSHYRDYLSDYARATYDDTALSVALNSFPSNYSMYSINTYYSFHPADVPNYAPWVDVAYRVAMGIRKREYLKHEFILSVSKLLARSVRISSPYDRHRVGPGSRQEPSITAARLLAWCIEHLNLRPRCDSEGLQDFYGKCHVSSQMLSSADPDTVNRLLSDYAPVIKVIT